MYLKSHSTPDLNGNVQLSGIFLSPYRKCSPSEYSICSARHSSLKGVGAGKFFQGLKSLKIPNGRKDLKVSLPMTECVEEPAMLEKLFPPQVQAENIKEK